jgi:hypothetical protein
MTHALVIKKGVFYTKHKMLISIGLIKQAEITAIPQNHTLSKVSTLSETD